MNDTILLTTKKQKSKLLAIEFLIHDNPHLSVVAIHLQHIISLIPLL